MGASQTSGRADDSKHPTCIGKTSNPRATIELLVARGASEQGEQGKLSTMRTCPLVSWCHTLASAT